MRIPASLTIGLVLLTGILSSGCEDNLCNCSCDIYNARAFRLNDTINMRYSELYCNPEYEFRLSFDSLSDSRCPVGAVCIWEGNASFRLTITSASNETSSFMLNTNKKFLTDTVVNGLRFELIDVLPYPQIDRDYQLEDIMLQVFISD